MAQLGYDEAIEDIFDGLQFFQFQIIQSNVHIFVCGGDINPSATVPASFRERFISHLNSKTEIRDSIVLAEEFHDYFADFHDLLEFEDAIASVSTLIIIFLESPGSLVELGLYCSRPQYYKKLLIVVPQDKMNEMNSFIILGPVKHIQKHDESAVLVYPFPETTKLQYEIENLNDLTACVEGKLKGPQKVNFDRENVGHLVFLTYEIIRICYPVGFKEIEIAFIAIGLDVEDKQIKKNLYLLTKLKMIQTISYSNTKFYYPVEDKKMFTFGRKPNGRIVEETEMKMTIAQSYVGGDDDNSRKRIAAKKQINRLLEDNK